MFDKNKSVKVGRDINIQVEKKNLENLTKDELTEKRKNSNFILRMENGKRLGYIFKGLIFGVVLFFLLYLGVPYLFGNYGNSENLIIDFFSKLIYDNKTWGMLSGLASFFTIFTFLKGLIETNEIEKKQYEILKTIRIILKEREYLKNSNNED